MRKIIIAICGIILAGGARATVENVSDAIKSAWHQDSAGYETQITINNGLYDIIKTSKTPDWEFNYVDITAATKIYKNGAKFCHMSLQHNYGNWKVFIAPESCQTICKKGHYGEDCESKTPTKVDCEINLTNKFDKSPWQETTIDVVNSGDKDSSKGDYYVVVLQVDNVDSNSVTVKPVSYIGSKEARQRTDINKIIVWNEAVLLCAPGYELEDNICVRKNCIVNSTTPSPESECPTTRRQGINANGDCEQCVNGRMFDKTKKKCGNEKPIDTYQLVHGIQRLFDCWREVGPGAYKECVTCPGGWEENEKRCYP